MIVLIVLFSMGIPVTFAQNARLPDTLAPTRYLLELSTDLEKNTFTGKITIEIKCLKTTREIVLNSKELDIPKEGITFQQLVDNQQPRPIAIQDPQFDVLNDFYKVPIGEDLIENSLYQLFIPLYNGKIRDDSQGFYKISYTDEGQPKVMALTLLVPNNARLVMPCFDEPFYKASIQLTISHDPKFTTASNTQQVGGSASATPTNNVATDTYAASPALSTYVMAFMVSELTFTEFLDDEEFLLTIFVRKDFANQIEFAHGVCIKALKFFATYFEFEYPDTRLDIGIIPEFPMAGMENYGFINVSESPILLDENTASIFNMYDAAYIICLELSNQWLGDVVTVSWWEDLWLTMAFGDYFSIVGMNNVFTEWKATDFGFLRKFQNTIEEDSLITSHPVVVPINDPEEINTLYDTITYEKAPYLLRMTNLLLGEENFKKSVATFISKYQYSTATRDDLWSIMTDIALTNAIIPPDLTIKAIMDTWLMQAGYPYIFVQIDYQNGKVFVSQQRFFRKLVQQNSETEKPPCWILPLSFTTNLEGKFETIAKQWFFCVDNSKPLEIPLSLTQNDWVIFNIRMQVPMQILYEEPNCKAIQKTLNQEKEMGKIEVLSRVQMILDAFSFAWQGKLTYQIAFDFIQYLKLEKEYLPWRVALRSLADLRYLVLRTKVFEAFQNMVRTLLEPKFLEFGPITELSRTVYIETHFKTFVAFWACSYAIKDCQTQSVKVFEAWMATSDPDTTNPVPADLRETIYCQGAQVKDVKYWNFLYDRYKNTQAATELSKISAALACSLEVKTLETLLDWSLIEANIRKEESAWVFSSVCDNDIAFDIVRKFLIDRFNDIYNYHQGDVNTLTTYLTSFATLIISDDELTEFQNFWDKEESRLDKVDRDSIIEKAQENIAWEKLHLDKLSNLYGV